MRSIALVSVDGSIDFLCFPNFDSPSVFAAILDPQRGGFLSISPDIEDLHTRQLYLPDTNILLTRFLSEAVVAEITDFMPIVESTDKKPFTYTTFSACCASSRAGSPFGCAAPRASTMRDPAMPRTTSRGPSASCPSRRTAQAWLFMPPFPCSSTGMMRPPPSPSMLEKRY